MSRYYRTIIQLSDFIQEIIDAFKIRVAADSGTYESEAAQYSILSGIGKPAIEASTLLLTPNAFKVSKLYSIVPDTGAGDWDVVRATSATRVNEDGLIEVVGNNVPRIDYLNGEPVVLVEPSATNLFLDSDPSSDPGQGIRTAVTFDSNDWAVGFNGKTIFGDNSTERRYWNISVQPPSVNTICAFVKMDDNSAPSLDGTAGLADFVFQYGNKITTGTIKRIEPLINDVYYCVGTGESTAFSGAWGITKRTLNRSKNFEVTGLCVFVGDIDPDPSFYIPTAGAAVTRNADVIDVDVPAETGEIVTTFEDDSTDIESSPGATYQLPNGRIKSVIFNP